MKKAEHIAEKIGEILRHAQWPPDGVLPPVRQMAQKWSTSVPTMLAALGILKERGVLQKTPYRSRFLVAGVTRQPARQPETGGCRSERIAGQLKDAIIHGEFPTDVLPCLKDLLARYHCTYGTVKRALEMLEKDGLLEEQKKHYIIAHKATVRNKGSSVYVAAGLRTTYAYNSHMFPLMLTLEKEVQRLGWGQLKFYFTDKPGTDAPPAHLVSTFIHIDRGSERNWGDFFRTCPAIPLIRIDYEELRRGRFPKHRSFLRIVPSNRGAGHAIARHLHELGHRRIAVFCHVSQELSWVQYRLQGIKNVFSQEEDITVWGPSRTEESDFSKTDLLKNGLTRALWELKNASEIPNELVQHRFGPAYDILGIWQTALRMQAQFEKALQDTAVTAWVCVNDDLAVLAHVFLKQHGITPGTRVSLAAFDNSPLSYGLGFTSYDFEIEKMALVAAKFLEMPDIVPRDNLNTTVLDGQLVARDSTGPIRN